MPLTERVIIKRSSQRRFLVLVPLLLKHEKMAHQCKKAQPEQ